MTYDGVYNESWLVLVGPLPYSLLRFRLERSVYVKTFDRWVLLDGFDGFLVIAILVQNVFNVGFCKAGGDRRGGEHETFDGTTFGACVQCIDCAFNTNWNCRRSVREAA